MANADQPNAGRNIWECHKAEIGRLYAQMTLKAVKEHMEKDHQFPGYSLSVWKKKVGRWGFDNKYNKRSTIEAAAAHFRETPRDRTLNPFAPSNGKIVSETELQRYLKRSKMILRNGKLQPEMPSSNPGTVISQRSPAAVVDDMTQESPCEPKESEEEPVVIAWNTQIAMQTKKHHASFSERRENLQYRKRIRRMRIAYLFGQGIVHAADLMIPESTHHHHTVLKGVEESIRSSWAAGRWSVSEEGVIQAPSKNVTRALEFFRQGYWGAAKLHVQGSVSQSRRLLWKVLDAFLLGLRFMLPTAISDFLDTLIEILEFLSLKTARTFAKFAANRICNSSDIYSGVQRLFSSIVAISSENFRYVLNQAYQVWSTSLVTNEDKTPWSVKVNLWRIHYDASLKWEERFDRACLYWESLLSDPKQHRNDLSQCFMSLINTYIECDGMDYGKDKLTWELNRYQSRNILLENSDPEIQAGLSTIRGLVYFLNGYPNDSIYEFEAAYRISVENDLDEKLGLSRILTAFYTEYAQDKLKTARTEYEGMMDNLASMCFYDAPFNEEKSGNESEIPCSNDGHTSVCSDMDIVIPKAEVDIDHVWQRYIDGEEYDMKRIENTGPVWRKDVDPSTRDHMTLCEDVLENDTEMSAIRFLEAHI